MNTKAKKHFEGVITALGTPLDENGNLHQESMRLQVHSQIEAGVSGLLCLGSMGLAQMQTPEVREQTVRVTMAAAKGHLPVLVGCGDCSTARTLQYVDSAETLKADGIVLITPYFPRLTDEELYDYFAQIAARTKLPIYLYDIPYYTFRHLNPDLIIKLAKNIPNIVGIKSSGELTTLRSCIEHFWDKSSFTVLSGHSTFLDQALLMGADGIVDGLFVLAPRVALDLYAAATSGNVIAALDAQRRLFRIRDILIGESVIATFSHLMNLLGVPGKFYCSPFSEISESGKERVQLMFQDLRDDLFTV